jgi:hypothetical protein|tara:strand:+ start:942 stop:1121 length:180 start_codon:yes stop_codon:yes gene_type:complete
VIKAPFGAFFISQFRKLSPSLLWGQYTPLPEMENDLQIKKGEPLSLPSVSLSKSANQLD